MEKGEQMKIEEALRKADEAARAANAKVEPHVDGLLYRLADSPYTVPICLFALVLIAWMAFG